MSRSNRQTLVAAFPGSAGEQPVPSPDQDALVAAVVEAQTGEPQGMRRFLEGIAPLVRRTCCGVLGPLHPELEDAIQDGLVAAMKALPQYRFEGDIRHYVTKIVLRIAIAARRRSNARWRRLEAIEQGADLDSSLVETRLWSDDLDLVRRIIDKLTGAQSEALLLRIVCGFSINEIATMTCVSKNTVKTRLRLGKNALRSVEKTSLWSRLFSRGSKVANSALAAGSEERS